MNYPPVSSETTNNGAPTTNPLSTLELPLYTDPPVNAGAPPPPPPILTHPLTLELAPPTHPSTLELQPSVTCSCKTRCATRKFPCKSEHRACSKYCHPGWACINTIQLAESKLATSCELTSPKSQMCQPTMPIQSFGLVLSS